MTQTYEDRIIEIQQLDADATKAEEQVEDLRWTQAQKIYELVEDTGKTFLAIAKDARISNSTIARYYRVWSEYHAKSVRPTFSQALFATRSDLNGNKTHREARMRELIKNDPELLRKSAKEDPAVRNVMMEVYQEEEEKAEKAAEKRFGPMPTDKQLEQSAERSERRHEETVQNVDALAYNRMESYLQQAVNCLQGAFEVAQHSTWDDEAKEVFERQIEEIKRLTDLTSMGVSKGEAVDWDTEMKRMNR